MKLFLAVILIVIIYACNQSSAKTIRNDGKFHDVFAVFDTGAIGKPNFTFSTLVRAIKDTVMFVNVDNETQKKKLVSDTIYGVAVKEIVKTKDGKDSTKYSLAFLPKQRVVADYGRVDSTIMKYHQQ